MADVIEKTAADTGADQTADVGAATDTGAALGASDAAAGAEGAAGDAGKQEADAGTGGTKTVADGVEGDDKAAVADWPEDWRERLAGDDEKELKRLRRFASPLTYAKAEREAQKKIRSGELKTTLPADASDEQKAAWRAENGIPDSPDGYDFASLPDGVIPGEDDMPAIDSFKQFAHEKNIPPDLAKDLVAWQLKARDEAIQAQRQTDKTFHDEAVAELSSELGAEFKPSINAMAGALETIGLGKEDRDLLFASRTPDGRLLGDSPMFLRAMIQMAREFNPAGTLVPGSGMNAGQSLAAEISALEGEMNADIDAWHKSPAKKDRLMKLYDARDKLGSRAA